MFPFIHSYVKVPIGVQGLVKQLPDAGDPGTLNLVVLPYTLSFCGLTELLQLLQAFPYSTDQK